MHQTVMDGSTKGCPSARRSLRAGRRGRNSASAQPQPAAGWIVRSTGSISKPIFRIDFEETPAAGRDAAGAPSHLSLKARLTLRERELVELICQGAANKDIAGRLSLSVGTVKKELNTLYQKIEVHSRGRR